MGTFTLALLLLTALAGAAGPGKDTAPAVLSLDTLYRTGLWQAKEPRPWVWLAPDTLTCLQTPAGGQGLVWRDLVRDRDLHTWKQADLLPPGLPAGAHWAGAWRHPDLTALLLLFSPEKVLGAGVKGDWWVRTPEPWYRLGGEQPSGQIRVPDFLPHRLALIYEDGGNLILQDLEQNLPPRALTTQGCELLTCGITDWVHEEEFSQTRAWAVSPDGKHLAYLQVDNRETPQYTLMNLTEGLYPVLRSFPYPKAGQKNPKVRLGLIPLEDENPQTTWWCDGGAEEAYIPRFGWHPDSGALLIQTLNSHQNHRVLWAWGPRQGQSRKVWEDREETWIDLGPDPVWLEGGRAFTVQSEREGFRRLYRVDWKNGATRGLTPVGMDMIDLLDVDARGKRVDFTASPDDPTAVYAWRSVSGQARRLTPISQTGVHRYRVVAGGKKAWHHFSRMDTPPRISWLSLPDHRERRLIEDNHELAARLAALPPVSVRFFQVPLEGGDTMDGWLMLPGNRNEEDKLPLLCYVYGEPWQQTALNRWGGSMGLWHRLLAQMGVAVASMDNHGTPAPKGKAWRKVVYGKIGSIASGDQAAGVKNLLARHAFLDGQRVGVWGWSGGGSMTLNLLLRQPEVYQMGMAVASVPHIRYYDSIYQERYTGLPTDEEGRYDRCSPLPLASRLRGHLLMVHGSGDDNVHIQGWENMVNALVEANCPVDLLYYPNRSHGIREGKNTSLHLFTALTRYVGRHLLKQEFPVGALSTRQEEWKGE